MAEELNKTSYTLDDFAKMLENLPKPRNLSFKEVSDELIKCIEKENRAFAEEDKKLAITQEDLNRRFTYIP